MKPLHIEFVNRPRWLVVWVPACLLAGIALGSFAFKERVLTMATQSIQSKTESVTSEGRQLRQVAIATTEANGRTPNVAQLKAAQKTLQLNWNPAFATIENTEQPGTRLLQFSIDSNSETIHLEYEVESVAQATTLTASMNAGAGVPPWRLEAVAGTGSSGAPSKMRATWSAKLRNLR